jgi:FKBP-type peptidyl-prolyl cis-trans isomerase SlyD
MAAWFEKGVPRNPQREDSADAQKVGAMLMSKNPQGRAIAMRVHEVRDKTIVVDFNHTLAGKTLNFDVKVTDIRAAEAR